MKRTPKDRGRAAAIACALIETAKLNGVGPQAWLADTLASSPDYKITRAMTYSLGSFTRSGQPGCLPSIRPTEGTL